VLGALPARFGVPVVVVQHIATGFVHGLATWLSSETRHPVHLAIDGGAMRPGHVYLAPDERQLRVAIDTQGALRLALVDGPAVGGFRPSATPLFESAAALRGDLLACILTGMGSDGVAGLRAVHAARGYVIAQDEASSVVWGMPREAERAGVADEVLPLRDIGPRIAALAGMPAGRSA
jgi:two-component system chemotaxis response regulator CheB